MKFDFGDFSGIAEFCVNFKVHKWDEVTELYFENGNVRIETPPPTFTQSSAKVSIYTEDDIIHSNRALEENHQWCFMRQAEDFAKMIISGDISTKYLNESLKDIEIIEEIYKLESAK
jgi:predicted dehydrogenase